MKDNLVATQRNGTLRKALLFLLAGLGMLFIGIIGMWLGLWLALHFFL